MPKSPTEEMIDQLQEAEQVLEVLDQHACTLGPPLSRAYSRMYNEVLALRDAELKEWNEDASCGLRDIRRMLYRCDNAESPYHADSDGPCDIYTPNYERPPIPVPAVHVCDTCAGKHEG